MHICYDYVLNIKFYMMQNYILNYIIYKFIFIYITYVNNNIYNIQLNYILFAPIYYYNTVDPRTTQILTV